MVPTHSEIQELLDMIPYLPITPTPSPTTFTSSSAAPAVNSSDIGLYASSVEAGPPMSTSSMSTFQSMPSNSMANNLNPFTNLSSSMPFSNSPLQQEPQFYPAINQPPFLIDQPSLHAAVPDNLGQTGMPSQFYNHGWAPKYASAPAQDPASPSGYALLNPTTMAVPIPEFIPEGHCFTNSQGVKQYKCLECGKCIQKCLFSFREHLETHKPDRKRFDCDWHGCYKKFTRSRDQLRHIAEDHLGTRAKQPSRAKLTGRRKGGQKQKD